MLEQANYRIRRRFVVGKVYEIVRSPERIPFRQADPFGIRFGHQVRQRKRTQRQTGSTKKSPPAESKAV
jgi:hypothetical protein